MKEEIIRFRDLSGWLKFAFIFTLFNASLTALLLIIYVIAGMVWLA